MTDRGNSKQVTDSSHKGSEENTLSLEDFRAELDVFSGPLDLLLHLIKSEEVDILEIQISRITDSYLKALETFRAFDINIAAEFLVMSATLMDIKSRTLLPDPIDDSDELTDPKDELIHQLLEYKKFKQVAARLCEMAGNQAMTYPRQPTSKGYEQQEVEVEDFLEDVDIWDCVSAYAELVRQIEINQPQQIVYDEVPVARYMEDISGALNQCGGRKSFLSFFSSDRSRRRIIGVFLALLELLKQGDIKILHNCGKDSDIIICQSEQCA